MAATVHGAADDGAVEHVVMGHDAAFAGLDGQARLGAVQRPDLALLVHRQHHGNVYPLRRLARGFRIVGVATFIYALAIVGIAMKAAIIEL